MKNLFVAALILLTTYGFSQNQGSLRGSIVDLEMQNEPLLFAHVQLTGVDLKTETNFRGNFEFDTLETGEYNLLISYAGYENIEMPITIKADEVTRVNLGMSAKTISFENVAGLAFSSEQNEVVPVLEELPKK